MSNNVGDLVKANRGLIAVVVGALVIGTGAGYWLSRSPGSTASKPDQPIEWNEVQAVPTRAPDADDADWQNRVDALDNQATAAAAAETDKNDAGAGPAALENASQ